MRGEYTFCDAHEGPPEVRRQQRKAGVVVAKEIVKRLAGGGGVERVRGGVRGC